MITTYILSNGRREIYDKKLICNKITIYTGHEYKSIMQSKHFKKKNSMRSFNSSCFFCLQILFAGYVYVFVYTTT